MKPPAYASVHDGDHRGDVPRTGAARAKQIGRRIRAARTEAVARRVIGMPSAPSDSLGTKKNPGRSAVGWHGQVYLRVLAIFSNFAEKPGPLRVQLHDPNQHELQDQQIGYRDFRHGEQMQAGGGRVPRLNVIERFSFRSGDNLCGRRAPA